MLPAEQRTVFDLHYYGGYSQTEIAQLTSTALGTVKTRTLHALRTLRANMDLSALAVDEGWSRPIAAQSISVSAPVNGACSTGFGGRGGPGQAAGTTGTQNS